MLACDDRKVEEIKTTKKARDAMAGEGKGYEDVFTPQILSFIGHDWTCKRRRGRLCHFCLLEVELAPTSRKTIFFSAEMSDLLTSRLFLRVNYRICHLNINIFLFTKL